MAAVKYIYLFFIFTIISGYNIDLQSIFLFDGPKDSYFGYSVGYLNSSQGLRFLVGSPKHVSHIGYNMAFFVCTPVTKQCEEVAISIPHREPVEKTGHWLGVSIETFTEKSAVICSHLRTQTRDEVPGYCYSIDENLLPHQLATPSQFSRQFSRAQYGISLHTVSKPKSSNEIMIGGVGVRDWTGDVFHYKIDQIGEGLQLDKNDGVPLGSYTGYSVTSGKFFENNVIYYASGAPRYKETGMVFIYQVLKSTALEMKKKAIIEGKEIGEYFGASVCSVARSKRVDVLLVGAPMHAGDTYDEGRVYIYSRNSNQYSDLYLLQVLIGNRKPAGRFGSTITSLGDINLNGHQDVAIGSPFEDDGKGSVYIYAIGDNGKFTLSQYIPASTLNLELSGFGISISKGEDVDNNKYPDILIGGFFSSKVLLLRSRPVIKIQGYVESSKQQLNINSDKCKQETTTCLEVKVCFFYLRENGPESVDINYELSIDTKYEKPRAKFFIDDKLQDNANGRITIFDHNCGTNLAVKLLSKSITDLSTPLVLKLSFKLEFAEENARSNAFNKLPPIVDPRYPSVDELSIAFSYSCKNQEICKTDLKISVETNFTKDHYSPLEIVSNFFVFQITVQQQKDPALLNQVSIKTNQNYAISSLQGTPVGNSFVTCSDSRDTCKLGNLFKDDNQVIFQLVLNVKMLKPGDLLITFNVTSTSEEVNPEDNTVTITFPVREVVDITGIGSPAKTQGFCDLKLENHCSIVHNYLITNVGEIHINEVIVNIEWPFVQTKSGDSLIIISQSAELVDGCTYTTFQHTSTATKLSEISQAILDCTKMQCPVVVTCNITHLPGFGEKDFKVNISGFLDVAAYKSLKVQNSLTIISVAKAVISFNKQQNAMQMVGHQSDNFTVTTTLIFSSLISLWPIIIGVIIGVLFLLLLMLLLVKLGFFKRNKPSDKTQAVTTHDSTEQIFDSNNSSVPNYTQQTED